MPEDAAIIGDTAESKVLQVGESEATLFCGYVSEKAPKENEQATVYLTL